MQRHGGEGDCSEGKKWEEEERTIYQSDLTVGICCFQKLLTEMKNVFLSSVVRSLELTSGDAKGHCETTMILKLYM